MSKKNEPTIKDLIYNSILEGIFSCEYRTGQILNEKELMESYNCSKSPVREALVSLCDENVLRNIPRYGYEIVRLTQDDVNDMVRFRYVLEGGMLKLFFNNLHKNQTEKLKEVNESCATQQDVWGHWECNSAFHLQLIAFCRNDYSYGILKRLMARLKCAYAQFYWGKWDENTTPEDTKHHIEIIDAIERKDLNSTLEALKLDLQDFGNMTCVLESIF